jgi:hypothetical protein
MQLSQALGGINVLGIDTAPFIYFIQEHETYIDRMDSVFRHVKAGAQGFTSVITLTEVLVQPVSSGHREYERAYT